MNKLAGTIAVAALVGLAGCQSMYYGTMEKFGVHKRDIMVDRVKEAQTAQKDAKTEFTSALDQFRGIVKFKGGDLEAQYNKLSRALERSEARAAAVHERIAAVEGVSDALFKEWKAELKQYNSEALKRDSERKLKETRSHYEDMLEAMKNAEAKMEPALQPLRDQVLYLKHNLNARAIGALDQELVSIQGQVDSLVREMEKSIAQADAFIATLNAP